MLQMIILIRRMAKWSERFAAPIILLLAISTLGLVGYGIYRDEVNKQTRDEQRESQLSELSAEQREVIAILQPEQADQSHDRKLDLFSDVAYETAQVLLLNMSPKTGTNIWITIGRLLSVLLAGFIALQAIIRLLGSSGTHARLWFWHYWPIRWTKYYIVCGLGRIGWPIVKSLTLQGHRVLVIERDEQNERIDDAKDHGAVVIIGDSTEESLLKEVHAHKADRIFIVTGNTGENVETLVDLQSINQNAFIHFEDETLRIAIDSQLPKIKSFNTSLTMAQDFIINDYSPLRPKTENEVALFIIIGFETMGQMMTKQITELAHFENRKRSRILILTPDPEMAAQQFLSRYPRFSPKRVISDWSDIYFDPQEDGWDSQVNRVNFSNSEISNIAVEYACNAIFSKLPTTIFDLPFLRAISKLVQAEGVKPTIIFCHENDHENYQQSVCLHAELKRMFNLENIPIFAWLSRSNPLSDILSRCQTTGTAPKAFGSYEGVIQHLLNDSDRTILSHICFAAYEQQKTKNKKAETPESTVSKVIPSDAVIAEQFQNDTADNRHSNFMAAAHFEIKLKMVGLTFMKDKCQDNDPIQLTSEQLKLLYEIEHNRWMGERLMKGYEYGEKSKQYPLRRRSMTHYKKVSDEDKKFDINQINSILDFLQRRLKAAEASG